MPNQIIQLYEYHVWANRIVFEHLRKLPEDVWNKDITSVFPSVCLLMSHIYAMDTMWLSVMRERPFDEARELLMRLIEESKMESLGGMEKRFMETENDYRVFLNTCDPERVISLTHPVFGSVNTPLSGLVQHVVNHGTYHRGNLTAMLRQLGHTGVPTDYAFYLYTV
jgi:uncharacterized damage-inducible protein DinB